MINRALKYLERGLVPIPLVHRQKTPALPWREFQTVRPTAEQVKAWFSVTPTPNIGIVTGAISGIVVVDLDGPDGITQAIKLGLKSPVMCNTGKGRHLYFKHPGTPVQNAVRLAPGVDIRGDGGYVVAPPSVHESGRVYSWVIGEGEMPTYAPPIADAQEPLTEGRQNPRGWIADALRNMAPGNIDNTLFKVCSRLRSDGYTQEDALALLEPIAMASGATPDHLPEKIRHVWSRYEFKDKPSEDGGLDKSESLTTFLDNEEKVQWLVPNVVAARSFGFVAGLPETCKTWLTMDLAIELARGGMWLGTLPTAKSKVLFIDQERFAGETRRRFKALFEGKKLNYREMDNNLTIFSGTTIRLDLDQSFEAFRRKLSELRPDIVIVDSFATFHTKEENSRKESQEVIERIKALRNEFGCTFMFIDHENKGVFNAEDSEAPSAMRLAGSVAKVAAAEFCFTVRSKGKNRSAVFLTKSTLGPALDPFFVQVEDLNEARTAIEVKAC